MILGIIGGIACGKSTFAKLFSAYRRVPYFDMDFISKVIMHNNEKELRILCNNYGLKESEHYHTFLKREFFKPENKSLKKSVEDFVMDRFPAYIKEIQEVYDCDLIIESFSFRKKDEYLFDYFVEVTASDKVRHARMKERGYSDNEIDAKILAQKTMNKPSAFYTVDTTDKMVYDLIKDIDKLSELGKQLTN